jgi:hypothetical protein
MVLIKFLIPILIVGFFLILPKLVLGAEIFGYSGIGNIVQHNGNQIRAMYGYLGETTEFNKMFLWISATSPVKVRGAIYSSNKTLIALTEEKEVENFEGWISLDISPPITLNAGGYFLAFNFNGPAKWSLKFNVANWEANYDDRTYGDWNFNPIFPPSGNTANSQYLTYEVSPPPLPSKNWFLGSALLPEIKNVTTEMFGDTGEFLTIIIGLPLAFWITYRLIDLVKIKQ